MRIKGLQRLTLVDYPETLACTIFLFGCNFRCGYCHNPELVTQNTSGQEYTQEEILTFLQNRTGYLDGVCITGGEPLLTLEKSFLKKIKALGYKIKLDTNGSFPEKLQEFFEEQLIDFVAMDIKTTKEQYEQLVQRPPHIERLEKSIRLITTHLDDFEFRTTILEEIHTPDHIKSLATWLLSICKKPPKLFSLQGFKPQSNLIDTKFSTYKLTSDDYLYSLAQELTVFFETVEIKS